MRGRKGLLGKSTEGYSVLCPGQMTIYVFIGRDGIKDMLPERGGAFKAHNLGKYEHLKPMNRRGMVDR